MELKKMSDTIDDNEYPVTGPYMTITDYMEGVASGVYGPDEYCCWVYIDEFGNLQEQTIRNPFKGMPPTTIAVAYYAA
jgi:hypothetical protein